MTTDLGVTAPQGSMLTGPTSFLRSGDGWTTRLDAARQGRRYVPRGGHLVDFGSLPVPRSSTTVGIRTTCAVPPGTRDYRLHTFLSKTCHHATVADQPGGPPRDARRRGAPALPSNAAAGAWMAGTGSRDTHSGSTAGRACGDDGGHASPRTGPAVPEERPLHQVRVGALWPPVPALAGDSRDLFSRPCRIMHAFTTTRLPALRLAAGNRGEPARCGAAAAV